MRTTASISYGTQGPRLAQSGARARVVAVVGALLVLLGAGAATAQEPVDLNAASREQLEALPGIGAKLAGEIVRERDENGPYSTLEDLRGRVGSLTPAALGKARAFLRVATSGQVVVQEGKVVTGDVVKKVLMRFAGEPSVREVQEQAVAYVRVHPEIVDSWRTRARLRALAPRFTADGQGTMDNDLRKVTNLDNAAAEIESTTDTTTARVGLEARWDLDRLIFEPQEMAVSREAVRTANLRDRVLEEITRRYFERRRLQVDLELQPPTELSDRVRKELRLQELTADIDAATGGWFSDKLEKAGRAPY